MMSLKLLFTISESKNNLMVCNLRCELSTSSGSDSSPDYDLPDKYNDAVDVKQGQKNCVRYRKY